MSCRTADRALRRKANRRLASITHLMAALWLVMAIVALIWVEGAGARNPVPHIVFLGDSLTAGLGVEPGTGYPERLQSLLAEEGIEIRLTNAGVSGDTTAGGLARLDWSVPEDTDGVVVALGANDALRGIPVSETRANLDEIISKLQARDIPVLLAGMLSPPNMGSTYAAQFNPLYRELAAERETVLYPFLLEGVAAQPSLNQADGMHPNEAGMTMIAERMLPVVRDFVRGLANP